MTDEYNPKWCDERHEIISAALLKIDGRLDGQLGKLSALELGQTAMLGTIIGLKATVDVLVTRFTEPACERTSAWTPAGVKGLLRWLLPYLLPLLLGGGGYLGVRALDAPASITQTAPGPP